MTDYRDGRRVGKNTVLLNSMSDGERTLRLREPLYLEMVTDPSTGLLIAQYEPLTLYAYGATKQAVQEQLADQLFVLWDQYGTGNSDLLAEGEEKLKACVREHLEEVADAGA